MTIAKKELTIGLMAGIRPAPLTSLFSRSLWRRDVAAGGPQWLPAILIFGSIAAVAYADFVVSSVSLGYLYILPLGISAMFLRTRISYALVAVCVFLHDLFGPPYPSLHARIAHNLTAAIGFTFVVYVIQRYVRQREQLDRTVRQQRDQLLQDLELAAQVQRMFLPDHPPSMPGLEIAGMMQPARGVSGDYYDYRAIDEHTIQLVIADVSGKSSCGTSDVGDGGCRAAGIGGEARHAGGGESFESRAPFFIYLLFQAKTHDVVPMNSSCFPIGMFDREACAVNSANLSAGDILVLYTDGVTEAENSQGGEFGMERLSALIRRGHTLSADGLMNHILESVTDFSRDVGFKDDATILVVNFTFDSM
jgi:sigma-B regulation protein RsbU (phosphoserine phosphatase)